MRKKILRLTLFIAVLVILTLGASSLFEFFKMRSVLISNSQSAGEEVKEISEAAMEKQITARLYSTAMGFSYTANAKLMDFAGSVRVIADSTSDIYNHPDDYGRTVVRKITPDMIGTSHEQFLYAEDVEPDSAEIQEELSLIGNQKGYLASLYTEFPDLAADYIGTKSGIMLLSGPVLKERWDEDGNYTFLDPRERPWFKGALEQKGLYFSGLATDYDTGESTIMCSYPVYKGDEIIAVAGAGIYLGDIRDFMDYAIIDESGSGCIIDKEGTVIFSTNESGEIGYENKLFNDSAKNVQLRQIIEKGLAGGSAVEHVKIDGERCYAAYSPIETVDWVFLSIIPEKIVTEPTTELLSAITKNGDRETANVDDTIKGAVMLMVFQIILVTFICFVMTRKLADRLTAPISRLTGKVENLDGSNLEFKWDLSTNDETETLALSFESMIKRLKQYISDNEKMTAEKEHISAELNVARDIQTSMLPNVFPAFPERNEFDIYALMQPAKEVGGDLYDFFMIDNDHLAITVADVSGKGVPASLFMTITKTHIKNRILHGSDSPSEILCDVNNLLCDGNDLNLFVTVWLGIVTISTGHVKAANAGHEYPVVMDSDGKFTLMKDRHGMPLAAMEDAVYKEYEFDLERNGGLFIYSDGIPEATNSSDEMYGTDRMISALNQESDSDPEVVIKRVESDVRTFYGEAPQFDDITMVSFRWN